MAAGTLSEPRACPQYCQRKRFPSRDRDLGSSVAWLQVNVAPAAAPGGDLFIAYCESRDLDDPGQALLGRTLLVKFSHSLISNVLELIT